MSAALLITLSMGLLVTPAPEPAVSTSDLTPGARVHHQHGLDALDAGEFEASTDALERAYSLLPDPLLHRDGRSKVMGSLRAALTEAHAATGDPAHLERLQALLLAHGEALRVALGPAGTTEDFAAIEAALRQVEAQLTLEATRPIQTAPGSVTSPVSSSVASPDLTRPAPSPALDRGRRLRISGGVLMGLGTAALGVMAYGIIVHVDDRLKLQSLTASVAASGERPTLAQDREARRHYERSDNHRSLAAVTGALGVAALVTGLALHRVGVNRARSRVEPALGARFAGVTWRLQF